MYKKQPSPENKRQFEKKTQPVISKSGTEFQHGNARAPQLNDKIESKHSNVTHVRRKKPASDILANIKNRKNRKRRQNRKHAKNQKESKCREPEIQPIVEPGPSRQSAGEVAQVQSDKLGNTAPFYKVYSNGTIRLVHRKISDAKQGTCTIANGSKRVERELKSGPSSTLGPHEGSAHVSDVEDNHDFAPVAAANELHAVGSWSE